MGLLWELVRWKYIDMEWTSSTQQSACHKGGAQRARLQSLLHREGARHHFSVKPVDRRK